MYGQTECIWRSISVPTFSFLSALQLRNGMGTRLTAVLIQQLTPSPSECWQSGSYYRARRSELPGEGSRKSYIQMLCRYSLHRLWIKLTPHIWVLSQSQEKIKVLVSKDFLCKSARTPPTVRAPPAIRAPPTILLAGVAPFPPTRDGSESDKVDINCLYGSADGYNT